MEITGHATWEMFDRYNTIDRDDAREAMQRLGDYLKREGAEGVAVDAAQWVTPEAAG